ncbi:MAG: iron-sulfur cluster assembly scaffold protein [Promethearchaeota archaeon]
MDDRERNKKKEDDFEAFVTQMQLDIDLQDKEDFSAYALELATNPYHSQLTPPSLDYTTHEWQGPCGDSVRWYVEINGDRITKAYYTTSGCTTATIASSQTAMLMEGKTIKEARGITDMDVLDALGKFPEADHHCATLAITSFNLTLDLYEENSKKRNEKE